MELVKRFGFMESIVEADEPIDPSCMRSLFPHIPSAVFKKLEKRRIDILIGLNYNGLFPVGGTGRNCRENLRVMKTRFGSTEWILGGSHSKLECHNPRLSPGAVEIISAEQLHFAPDIVTRDSKAQVENRITALRVSTEPMLTPEFWERDDFIYIASTQMSKVSPV